MFLFSGYLGGKKYHLVLTSSFCNNTIIVNKVTFHFKDKPVVQVKYGEGGSKLLLTCSMPSLHFLFHLMELHCCFLVSQDLTLITYFLL